MFSQHINIALAQPGGHAPPARNWVHKKIPGCAVELNTQNCAWFGSQISLITAMSFREAMLPPNHPPGALSLDPAGGLPFPRPPVPPTSKSWLRHCNTARRSIVCATGCVVYTQLYKSVSV